MKYLDELKTKMQGLLDKAEDKELIGTLTSINETINNIDKEYTTLESEERQLLNDYKDLIKHTSFKVEKEPERGAPQAQDFDTLFANALAEINNKK